MRIPSNGRNAVRFHEKRDSIQVCQRRKPSGFVYGHASTRTGKIPAMEAQIKVGARRLVADLRKGLDISIPVEVGVVRAFGIPSPRVEPYRVQGFVGDVREGGSCNCEVVHFTPHGNGTHTECVGHWTLNRHRVLDYLKHSHFFAQVVTISPQKLASQDQVIYEYHLRNALQGKDIPEALVIRTTPNAVYKRSRSYSNTNPPYFDREAMAFLVEIGVKQVLVDLPSVDRENDGGKLEAHQAFWGILEGSRAVNPKRKHCTITELIYVPETIADGEYLLNLQVVGMPTDASPSRPVLYRLTEVKS